MRETARAKQAFNDYLAMGDGRSLPSLYAQYQSVPGTSPCRRYGTLKTWSRLFDWTTRLEAIAEQQRQAIIARGIIDKQNRLDMYNDLAARCNQVVEARAGDSSMKGPGSNTGLLVRTYKATKIDVYEEYSVDTALIREMRELAKQAATEMGQWIEKQEQNTNAGLTLEERIALLREADTLRRESDGSNSTT